MNFKIKIVWSANEREEKQEQIEFVLFAFFAFICGLIALSSGERGHAQPACLELQNQDRLIRK